MIILFCSLQSCSVGEKVEKHNKALASADYIIFGGIKKEYNLSKKIRGNIQMMYNFHDRFYKTSPYADRLNVRMGLEFPMKKKISP